MPRTPEIFEEQVKWSLENEAWEEPLRSEIYIFLETHLGQQQHASVCQYFTARGRQAYEGTHGGIFAFV